MEIRFIYLSGRPDGAWGEAQFGKNAMAIFDVNMADFAKVIFYTNSNVIYESSKVKKAP